MPDRSLTETGAVKLVCIGGGHGLGRLLSALSDYGEDLCGVVATTDNGGSTGRLRDEANTIAWGDLRNCLNQLCDMRSVARLLFEYRFHTDGDLNGHNLGNLMLYALDQMSLRPTDAIEVMREMLHIKPRLFPMSDTPVSLIGHGEDGLLDGELAVDDYDGVVSALSLSKPVDAPREVIERLEAADIILLSPGSFQTSVMPSLLVPDIADAINQSAAPLVLMANLMPERLGRQQTHQLSLSHQLALLAGANVRQPDQIVWPSNRPFDSCDERMPDGLFVCDIQPDSSGLHCESGIRSMMATLVSTLR